MKFRLIGLVALIAMVTYAAPIAGVGPEYNTGAGLAGGASDPNWSIVSPSQQGVVISATLPGPWLPNTVDSQWIWQTADGTPVGTPEVGLTRTFRFEFTIGEGFDLSTASITGRWATDNFGDDILFNGVSTGQENTVQFTDWTIFSLTSGFVTGLNYIEFVVRDMGGVAGFRAEFTDSNIELAQTGEIPEPGTWLLLGTGILLTGILRRRRSSMGA